jgi:hypothetical protein
LISLGGLIGFWVPFRRRIVGRPGSPKGLEHAGVNCQRDRERARDDATARAFDFSLRSPCRRP